MNTAEQRDWLRHLWFVALETGKYKKCRHQLCGKEGCHCALGVACRIAYEWGLVEHDGDSFGKEKKKHTLPYEVVEAFGFINDTGSSCKGGLPAICDLNDCLGYTFKRIAHHVESHLSSYFV